MSRVSTKTATRVEEQGPSRSYGDDIDGYTVAFVSLQEDVDLGPLLVGLPDDLCPCPHWGYMLNGRLTWRYADHEETVEAGDAFYVPAGHSPKGWAGSEFLLFSPADQMAEVDAHLARAAQSMSTA